jgi:hypothetical protein
MTNSEKSIAMLSSVAYTLLQRLQVSKMEMVTRQGCMIMGRTSLSLIDKKLPRAICRSFYKKQASRQHGTPARIGQGRSAARIPRLCLMRDAQVDTTPDPAAHALKVKHTNTQSG